MRAAEVGFLTSRGYRAAKSRPASARTLSDQLAGAEVARLHAENCDVYGVRKRHRLLKRQGWEIGRDQTGRLMRSLGLRGVKRGKRVFTTKSDPAGRHPTDLVQRHFRADAPRRLWVVDVTGRTTWLWFTRTESRNSASSPRQGRSEILAITRWLRLSTASTNLN